MNDVFGDLEIVDTSSVQCKTDFEIAVIMNLTDLSNSMVTVKQDMSDVNKSQTELENFLIGKVISSSGTTIDFAKKYNLKLPIKKVESFTEFENSIKSNDYLRNDVYQYLKSLVDDDFSITKTFVSMLKAFMKKEVALQFTAARKSLTDDSERKFKDTELYKLMCSIIVDARNEHTMRTTDKDLIKGLSDVLCNVKNWDKGKE